MVALSLTSGDLRGKVQTGTSELHSCQNCTHIVDDACTPNMLPSLILANVEASLSNNDSQPKSNDQHKDTYGIQTGKDLLSLVI
jgi:hypothetical protein